MKLGIAGDSAGEPLALALYDYLRSREGIDAFELSKSDDGSDEFYANLADRVCSKLQSGELDRAILVCGTGIGVSIAANKVPGIRAALTHDTYSAAKASTSNNAQVITMGARVIAAELAKTIVDAWLNTSFNTEGPSAGNVNALDEVDAKYKA
ncbi:MAG: RpiB/LacA/LacB family sugar-phosphate isomerase [Hyphomicrobiales bacterium]